MDYILFKFTFSNFKDIIRKNKRYGRTCAFFLKVVPAAVEFVKDATGNINSCILYQGGREMKAKRK